MQRQSFQAVIFDFDGTLADSYAAITASVNHVRTAHGLPPLEESLVRRSVGRGPEALLRDTVPQADVQAAVRMYRAHHPSVMRSGTRVLPGVEDTLAALYNSGLRLGVCSNKPGPFTRGLLDYLRLSSVIEAVIGPEDAPRPKPAPDMLLVTLQRLGVTPSSALYVGDMVVDIETARAAGVTVWVVPTGSEERDVLAAAKPDRLLPGFVELLRLVGPNG
jgi:phosphoglycolate phosphatase